MNGIPTPDDRRPDRPARPGSRWLLGALALGAFLRIWKIADQPIWWDEAITAFYFARADYAWAWGGVSVHLGDSPLYPLLMTTWSLLGGSVEWIRGFSALWGIAGIAAMAMLSARVWSEPSATRGVLLLTAVSAFLVYYAQEARGYTLLFLLGTLSLHGFFSIVFPRPGEVPSRATWAIFTVANALMLYSHYFSGLTLLAYNIVVFTRRRGRVPLAAWVCSQALSVLFYAPWVPRFVNLAASAGSYDYISHVIRQGGEVSRWLEAKEAVKGLLAPPGVFLLGKSLIPAPGTLWNPLVLAALAIGALGGVLCLVAGFVRLLRERGRDTGTAILLIAILPPVVAVVVTLMGVPAYNYTRVKYLSAGAPLFLLLAGAAAGGRSLALKAAFGGLVAANLVSLASYRWNPECLKDSRLAPAVGVMAETERTPYIAVNTIWVIEALRYHVRQDAPGWTPEILNSGRLSEEALRSSRSYTLTDLRRPFNRPEPTMESPREWPARLWLVAHYDARSRALDPAEREKRLAAWWTAWELLGYRLDPVKRFDGVDVRRAERPSSDRPPR